MKFKKILLFTVAMAFFCHPLFAQISLKKSDDVVVAEQEVALLLRLKKNSKIYLESNKPSKLPKDSLVSLKIPKNLLAENSSVDQIDLKSVVEKLQESTPEYHSVTVLESSQKTKNLIGNEGLIRLSDLANNKLFEIEDVEEPTLDMLDDLLSRIDEPADFDFNLKTAPCTLCGESSEAGLGMVAEILNRNYISEFAQNYENSKLAQLLIIHAKQKISYRDRDKKWRLKTRSGGWCAQYVRIALEKAIMSLSKPRTPPVRLEKNRGRLMGQALAKHGFTNLLETSVGHDIYSPYDAPIGSILVYDGGKSGHTEIRTENGFISDYFSRRARTGDPSHGREGRYRKLIGVYIKIFQDQNEDEFLAFN